MSIELVYFNPLVTKDSKRNVWVVDQKKKVAYFVSDNVAMELMDIGVVHKSSTQPRKKWAEDNKITLKWKEPSNKELVKIRKAIKGEPEVKEEKPPKEEISTEDIEYHIHRKDKDFVPIDEEKENENSE